MNHPVLLKGNSIGLTMVLDPEMKFEQLKAAICEKFIQAKDFFNGQTQIALKIEGRKLTSQQLEEVLGMDRVLNLMEVLLLSEMLILEHQSARKEMLLFLVVLRDI